jgi:hypothetical protein
VAPPVGGTMWFSCDGRSWDEAELFEPQLVVDQVEQDMLTVAEAEQPSELAISQDRQLDLPFGLPLVAAGVSTAWQPFITSSVWGCAARRGRRLLIRTGAGSGDLFVTAVQVMNTAIATNWHVAAAHTKAWKTS